MKWFWVFVTTDAGSFRDLETLCSVRGTSISIEMDATASIRLISV